MWKHIALGIIVGFWGSIGSILLVALLIGLKKSPLKWLIRREKCPECEDEKKEECEECEEKNAPRK